MNVADLQRILRGLAELLGPAATKTFADELAAVANSLEPFREDKLRAFAARLTVLASSSDGQARPEARKQKGKATPPSVEAVRERVKVLYSRALDPALTTEMVEQEVRSWEPLKKPELEEVAKGIGIVIKYPNKGALLAAIVQAILDRKGMSERASV